MTSTLKLIEHFTTTKIFSVPIEYFTLAFDMPFMLLLSDLRQGVFYATLLSFWLVFAGEHMLVSWLSLTQIIVVMNYCFLDSR